MSFQSVEAPFSLYQSEALDCFADRLAYGFTGKPLSLGGPDTPDNPREQVLANRQALLGRLSLGAEANWTTLQQTHGHRIGRTGDLDFQQTDGILLTRPNDPVMLFFADCVPVLLYDPVRHVGAVAHAGWRGTAQGIAREAVLAMQNTAGTRPADVIALIGPAIGFCCFQVSRQVVDALAASLNVSPEDADMAPLLAWDEGFPDNPRVDLKAVNRLQLQSAGVGQIETSPLCTCCERERLFSYRRGDNGRNSAWMTLHPASV